MKNMDRLTIEIPVDLKRKVKILAASESVNMKIYITRLILDAMNKSGLYKDEDLCGYGQ